MMRRGVESCPDNLLARGRRGPLSELEQRALEAHLDHCGACRAAAAFSASFDDPDEAPAGGESGDERVISRLAAKLAFGDGGVTTTDARPKRRAGATAAAAVAVGLVLAGGGAAAWVSLRPALAPEPDPAPAQAPVGPRARSAGPEIPRAEPVPPRPPITEPTPSAPQVPSAPPRALHAAPPRVARAAAARDARAASAAELFASANMARRRGDLPRAVGLYRNLQARFPDSDEASLSFVSLGEVLSRHGDTAAALAAFDGYLAERPAGRLAQESLFGRASCLQRLGRADDERRAWDELLRRFPGSVYERAGRRRIAELSR
jgi:TolA-binding protein